MKKHFWILLATVLLALPAQHFFAHQISKKLPTKTTEHPSKAKIQVALLLDTSNSMDGLIAQAKTQLWKMVNELASAHRGGDHPAIELALYHYGNSGLSGEQFFIKKLTPLTTDLDLVSEKLFSLQTNGGNEYCGAVIKTSLDELEWTNHASDLRLILIAGNESFAQGPVAFNESCIRARKMGVQINTIFCGDYLEGKRVQWEEGAKLAEGKYLNIDQDRQISIIRTPYDDQIIQLNLRLNRTYLGYGQQGRKFKERQIEQDKNAYSLSESVAVDRSLAKSKSSYNNAHWDIVDAVENEAVVLDEIQITELPEEMQNMDEEEQKVYVEKLSKERKSVQRELKELAKKAEQYRLDNQDKNNQNTLDAVLIEAVKDQARKKNFEMN